MKTRQKKTRQKEEENKSQVLSDAAADTNFS